MTATSPAMQGAQSVATDASGFYRIPNLPPGTYEVRTDREGHSSSQTDGVQLRASTTVRLDLAMVPENVAGEQLAIVQTAPTIDVGSSSVAMTISEEMAKRVPISRPGNKGAGVRSFEALAEAAPEAKTDLYGTSVAGTTSPENRYLIDGLAVNNTAYGLGGTALSAEFVKEVNVVTGGYLPEYGRATGGILDVVTKSGSNSITGSAWSFVTPGVLEGKAGSTYRAGNTIAYGQPTITLISDIGADVGLPIVRDKLWLYLGVDLARSSYEITRGLYQTRIVNGAPQLDGEMNALRDFIPGTEDVYDATGWSAQVISKLSFAPTANNALSLTTIVAPGRSGGGNNFGIDPETGRPDPDELAIGQFKAIAYKYESESIDNLLKWTASSGGKRVVLDTTLGWHHETYSELPSDGSRPGSRQGLANISSTRFRRSNPGLHTVADFEPERIPAGYCVEPDPSKALVCPLTTYAADSVGIIRESTLDRYQLRSVATILANALGHHVIKAGLDFELTGYDVTKAYAGGNLFRESTSGTSYSDYRNFGYLIGPDTANVLESISSNTKSLTVGGFLQNSWSVADKVTLNAGLRYDTQYMYNSAGDLGLVLPNQWSPRLGFIWDPTQSGRSRVFGSYARYYQSVPLDLADRALSGEPQVVSSRSATKCNPRDPVMARGACRDLANLNVLGQPEDPNQKWALQSAGTVPVDPDIVAPSLDELVLGSEYELFAGSRVGVTYSRRRLNEIIEDMSRDEATTYFLGNPGRGIAASFPKPQRDYDAFTLFFAREFARSWLAQGSYSLSWLRGNYSGLFRPETEQLDPNITADFDLESLLGNRTGPLPGDRRHQFKVFAARDLEVAQHHHMLLGLGARATSGDPTSYLGSHPIYGADEVFVTERGSGPRLPWNGSLDLQLGYTFVASKDISLTALMDVWNVLNWQETLRVEERFTTADVLPAIGQRGEPDPATVPTVDGEPLAKGQYNEQAGETKLRTQAPRIFRFGLRASF